jgi:hypothetical protein
MGGERLLWLLAFDLSKSWMFLFQADGVVCESASQQREQVSELAKTVFSADWLTCRSLC